MLGKWQTPAARRKSRDCRGIQLRRRSRIQPVSGVLLFQTEVIATASLDALGRTPLRLFDILRKPQLDYLEIEEVVKSDPALCYRLLRFLNSPVFSVQHEIRSVLHALTLLGEEETRKWLLLASAVMVLPGSRSDLLSFALVRARFAELLADAARVPAFSLFVLGLLSAMESILGISATVVADYVASSDDIRAALKGQVNSLGECLQLVIAFEAAKWDRCDEIRQSLGIPAETLKKAYLQAIRWARRNVD